MNILETIGELILFGIISIACGGFLGFVAFGAFVGGPEGFVIGFCICALLLYGQMGIDAIIDR